MKGKTSVKMFKKFEKTLIHRAIHNEQPISITKIICFVITPLSYPRHLTMFYLD